MALKEYENIFILKPDLPDEEIDSLIGLLKNHLTENGGTINEEDRWGTKRLAYQMRKFRYGYYALLRFSVEPEHIRELETIARHNENFLKSLVLLHDGSTGKGLAEEKAKEESAEKKSSETAKSEG